MAHYVAEKISAAESATDNDRAAKEEAAAEAILALWQRRSGLPGNRSPMQAFERVFSALDRLAEPQDPWSFYRIFRPRRAGRGRYVSSTMLRLALDLEDSARGAVHALVAEAAAMSLDREAEWVRLSANLAEDEERRRTLRLKQLIEQ